MYVPVASFDMRGHSNTSEYEYLFKLFDSTAPKNVLIQQIVLKILGRNERSWKLTWRFVVASDSKCLTIRICPPPGDFSFEFMQQSTAR